MQNAEHHREQFELAYATAWAKDRDGSETPEQLAAEIKSWRIGDTYGQDLPRLRFGWEGYQWARASQCLAQIEEPVQPVAPVLDDRWKARMLDGRAIERDEMGLGDHPELPMLDEGMMPRSFFAALGLELAHTSAEGQLDWDVLGAMSEAVNWTDWQPNPPHGDGWKLVSIFDTEDGPVAWWLRELLEAEDGTTTIRILQAEVEKLKARIARAVAAPAAVAPQGEYPQLPEAAVWSVAGKDGMPTLGKGWMFSPVQQGNATLPLFTAQQMWAYHDLGRQSAPLAPALEAPAAPALPAAYQGGVFATTPDGGTVTLRFSDASAGEQWFERLTDGFDALAAAPQAPRMGEDALHLLRRLLSNQHTLTGPEFRAELEKIVAEESARHAAAPQAPAAPSAYSDDMLAALHQWRQRCEVMGAPHLLPDSHLLDLEEAGLLRKVRGGHVMTTAGRAALAAPAAPAVDASDVELLDFLQQTATAVEVLAQDEGEPPRFLVNRAISKDVRSAIRMARGKALAAQAKEGGAA